MATLGQNAFTRAIATSSNKRNPMLRCNLIGSRGQIIMAQPSPLSVLSGALKIADKVTVAMEAVGDKIRLNSQGWKDARVIGERQGADGRGA